MSDYIMMVLIGFAAACAAISMLATLIIHRSPRGLSNERRIDC
jgi:hypothetical protein